MITDVRSYYLTPGTVKEYLQIFDETAMPIQRRHGLNLIAYLVSEIGPLNHVLHIWSYDDLADLERKRAARNADPEWAHYLEKSKGLIVSQDNKIMRPASFSPLQ